MHVLNNFLAFGLALAFGDMTARSTRPASSWWMILTTLTQSLVYLGAGGLGRAPGRHGPPVGSTRARPVGGAVLEGSPPRV